MRQRFLASLGLHCCLLSWLAPAHGQDLVISEFLAANSRGLVDSDGDRPDWIEVRNRGAAAVDLADWSLTDDAADLRKWRFPSRLLDAGAFLVVFASGKDRTAGTQLHTSFQLVQEGEYLALVRPNGESAHELKPSYPPQRPDVSFGLPQGGDLSTLVAKGAEGRVRVPTADDDPTAWTLPEFDDAGWLHAVTGVGFDSTEPVLPPPEQRQNLARAGTASQSSDYAAVYGASAANDGEFGNFTATAAADNDPTWQVDLGATHSLALIVVHNRGDGCCQERLRDITVTILDEGGATVHFDSGPLNPGNVLGNPKEIALDLLTLTDEPVNGRIVRVRRSPDPNGAGDDRSILSLGEAEVIAGGSSLAGLIATDIGASMEGVNASMRLRVPFTVPDPLAVESLLLRVQHDDGFVAYLNGVEVARQNAPGTAGEPLAWSAAALASRPDGAAQTANEINISAHRSALRAGANLLAIQGLNASAADRDFVILPELVALTAAPTGYRYFKSPTPGAANTTPGVEGFVEDTRFSVTRGFFDAPFDVEITTTTDGAEIRYTLDRTAPTATKGTVYAGPVRVTTTAVLRAAAFKAGLEPTNVDTQTYLFVASILTQPTMLKDMVKHAVYGPLLAGSLKSVPSISIVTRDAINPTTEVAASIELIDPDGRLGFQIDGGVKKTGAHSLGAYPKNSMRLYFRAKYGDAKLKSPVFEGERNGWRATDTFDRLNLRSSHDSVFYLGDNQQPPSSAQYLRNRWIADAQFDMDHLSLNSRPVQVYVNSVYWGMYDLGEWPSQEYLATYLGGEDREYSSIKAGAAVGESSAAAWSRILQSATNYNEVRKWCDVENFAEYMVLQFYAGNAWDWNPGQNWMAGGPVAADRGGFQFFSWDSDIIFRNTQDNNTAVGGPGSLFTSLMRQVEFRLLFADRVQRHLTGNGVLTPTRVAAGYAARADEIRSCLVAETSRWRWNTIFTRDNQWKKEFDRLLGDFIPKRSAIALDQLRRAGLLPNVAAPRLSHNGGRIEPGFEILLSPQAQEVHYTVDGSDPRLPGGAIAPTAAKLDAAGATIAIDAPTTIKARAKAGNTWSALTEASYWLDAPLRVTELLFHPATLDPASLFGSEDFEYVEIANVGAAAIDLRGWKLSGGIAFDFETSAMLTLAPGEALVIVENREAFAERFGAAARRVAGEFTGKLANLGDRIRLENPHGDLLLDFAYSGRWYEETLDGGKSLVAVDPAAPPEAWGQPESWKPSEAVGGTPGVLEGKPPASGRQVPGDINQDVTLDLSDAVGVLGHLFLGATPVLPCDGGTLASVGNRTLLDVGGDGGVDLSDAVGILSYLFLSGPAPALGIHCAVIEGCPDLCRP